MCCSMLQATAQNESVPAKKDRHFTFYGGIGPSYYFNNLVVGKQGVHELSYSVVGRFMWEPEHFLSLGFETGYFKFYTADYATGNNTAHITNAAIPIQLVISMKFSNKFYGNWAMGQSVTLNKVTTTPAVEGDHDASTWSLADFSATAGYRFIQK